MQLHDLDTYAFAIDWSVWIAAIVALSVFVLVTRLMLNVLPTLHFNLAFRPRLSLPKSWRPESWRPESWRRVSAQRLAVVDQPTEVDTDAEWHALTGILETRADRLHALSATQERAERCIEAAEYALERLLADCAAVQLISDEDTRLQRRPVAPAGAPAVLPAASPEPLAA
jgi:hypothetical protein